MDNNFSESFRNVLIEAEKWVKGAKLKDLRPEDIFPILMDKSGPALQDLYLMYGISPEIISEITSKNLFNESLESREGEYLGIHDSTKSIMLASLKIAASFGKEKASLEDMILAFLRSENKWLSDSLDYIGIDPQSFETNILDLYKIGIIDGKDAKSERFNPNQDESISGILGEVAESMANIASLFGGKMDFTPFDVNENGENNNKESSTPALDFFSTDLTKMAREGKLEKVIGRELEIERLIAILNRKTKNNPALVGEPGVGKTAIVEGLAMRIVEGKVPFSMKYKKILSLELSSLVAGTKYRGEFETRIKQVVEEASKVENEIVLFIDEIHTIIGAGAGEGTLDAGNILKPAMGRGKIRVIGATTLNEYQKHIEKDSALERRFQKINVPEPNREDAILVLSGLKESFEDYHNLNISEDAIVSAVDLSTRYITDRYLPDKAIDLVDEACSLKSMKYEVDEKAVIALKEKIAKKQKAIETAVSSQQYKKANLLKEDVKVLELEIVEEKKKFKIDKDKRMSINSDDIRKVLSMSSGIPVSNLNDNDLAKLKNLGEILNSEIIGQKEASENIVKSIMRSKSGIGNPDRPLGSFLFLGPTGVGKTEIVKTLAREFYGSEDSLIKVDMSEYSDKTSVNKMVGASAGYVGYEEGGVLTEKVRRKPYSIILFDEIEKGGFESYNILLQILEEGMLTDNKGRKINFKNTIIVMTSNIGQEEFTQKAVQIGFDISEDEENKVISDFEKSKERIIGNLTDYFPPEFINRIDKIIVFNPLDKENISKIVEKNLKELVEKLKKVSVILKYTKAHIDFISKEVYNPEFGAREIRRYLTQNIEDFIAESLILNPEKKDFKIKVLKGKMEIV